METKLVIFDYDGVIANSFPAIIEVYDLIAEKFGIKKPKESSYYYDFFEVDYRETLKKWGISTEEDINKVNEIFISEVAKREMTIKLFPDIYNVLERISNYKLAIASNNYRSIVLQSLMKNKIDKHFSLICGLEDGRMKPFPDLIIKAMNTLGYRPEESVYIGDMDGDIIAGKRAGVKKTIATTYGWHSYHRLKDADVIISKPSEIIGAVK